MKRARKQPGQYRHSRKYDLSNSKTFHYAKRALLQWHAREHSKVSECLAAFAFGKLAGVYTVREEDRGKRHGKARTW